MDHVELNNLREENNKLYEENQELKQQIYDLENRREKLIDLISNGINKKDPLNEIDIFDLILTSFRNKNSFISYSDLFFLFYTFEVTKNGIFNECKMINALEKLTKILIKYIYFLLYNGHIEKNKKI